MSAVDYHRPKSPLEESSDLLSWLFLLLIFFITARHFPNLPERVPTHINAAGEADAWGARWTVWLLPMTAVLLFGLISLAQKFPKLMNYPVRITPDNAQRQYDLARTFLRIIRASVLALLLCLQWFIIDIARGGMVRVNPLIFIVVFPPLIVIPLAVYLTLAVRRK